MNKNLHNIDKLFKDGLDDHLEPAPPGVWDAVSSDLDKKQAFDFRKKYDRLKRLALVVLLLVFAGITGLLYFSAADKKNTQITQNRLTNKQAKRNPDFDSVAVTQSSAKKIVQDKAAQPNENNGISQPAAPSSKMIDAAKLAVVVAENPVNSHDNSARENKISALVQPPAHTEDKAITVTGASNENIHPGNRKIERAAKNNRIENDIAGAQLNARRLNPSKSKLHAYPDEDALQSTAGKKVKEEKVKNKHTPFETGAGNDHLETGNNELYAGNAKNHEQAEQRKIIALAPWLYQPSLITAPAEMLTSRLFKAMDSTSFINKTAKNAIPQKATAVMKIKASNKHAVSLVAFASPNHSFTRLENDNQRAGPGRGKDIAKKEEQQGASFSAGVLVNYGLTSHVILQSGIVFSSAKTNISPKIIYARPDNNGRTRYEFNCSSGYSYITPKSGAAPAIGDSIKVMGAHSSISYIGIPLSLNYVWQKGRFLLKPGIGFSVNFLTNGKSATTFGGAGNQKNLTTITGLRKAYLDGSIGLGAEWMLSKRIAIGITPLLRMALTSINKDTPVRTYQNFMSLETGIRINL